MTSQEQHDQTAHAVEQLRGLTPQQVQQLHSQWIYTVEELLSLAATPAGTSGLARLLGLSPEQFAEVTREAADIVGPEAAEKLRLAQPGGPIGVKFTEEQKKNLGLM
jgi:hypothetical protein